MTDRTNGKVEIDGRHDRALLLIVRSVETSGESLEVTVTVNNPPRIVSGALVNRAAFNDALAAAGGAPPDAADDPAMYMTGALSFSGIGPVGPQGSLRVPLRDVTSWQFGRYREIPKQSPQLAALLSPPATTLGRTRIVEFEAFPIGDASFSTASPVDGRTNTFTFPFPVGGRVVRSGVSVTSVDPSSPVEARRAATVNDFTVSVSIKGAMLTSRVRHHDGRVQLDEFVELNALNREWADAVVAKGEELGVMFWMRGHALGECAPARIILRYELVVEA